MSRTGNYPPHDSSLRKKSASKSGALFGNYRYIDPLEQKDIALKKMKKALSKFLMWLLIFSTLSILAIIISMSVILKLTDVTIGRVLITIALITISLLIGINSVVRMGKELCIFFRNWIKARNISKKVHELRANACEILLETILDDDRNSKGPNSNDAPHSPLPPLVHNGFSATLCATVKPQIACSAMVAARANQTFSRSL